MRFRSGVKGERVEIDDAEIVALGRHRWYGSFVITVLARLTDGAVVQVMAADQTSDMQRWLRRRLRAWKRTPDPQRDLGFARTWEDEL